MTAVTGAAAATPADFVVETVTFVPLFADGGDADAVMVEDMFSVAGTAEIMGDLDTVLDVPGGVVVVDGDAIGDAVTACSRLATVSSTTTISLHSKGSLSPEAAPALVSKVHSKMSSRHRHHASSAAASLSPPASYA